VLPWVLGFAGTMYGAAATVCGAIFLVLAVKLHRSSETDRRAGQRVFMFSIVYLFVLFAALLAGDGARHNPPTVSAYAALSASAPVQAQFRPRPAETACGCAQASANEV